MAPYIAAILRGSTRPSRTSWLIWTVVSAILLASSVRLGARNTVWLAAAYCLIPLTIFGLSIGYGEGKVSRLDWFCLAGTALGILAWFVLGSPQATLFICIAMDALGAIPTVRKAYCRPRSESLAGWAVAFLAATINLGAITDWTPGISAYPLYAFALSGLVCLTVAIGRGLFRSSRPEIAM